MFRLEFDLNENKTELFHISQITPNINEHIGHSVSGRPIRESRYERLFNVFCRPSAVIRHDWCKIQFHKNLTAAAERLFKKWSVSFCNSSQKAWLLK